MPARFMPIQPSGAGARHRCDTPAHAALTRRLAQAALAHDRRMGWRLLDQPARLRIVTIDALAAALARQAPLAAGLGALPAFVDDAQALYREAARGALAGAPANDPHWQTFLRWLDNDADDATRLIAEMLAARDRWPARMFDDDAEALRADMEAVLQQEARAAIGTVLARLPASLARALPELAECALDFHRENVPMPAHAHALEALCRERALPGARCARDLVRAGRLAADEAGTFLRAPRRNHGFPAKGRGEGAQERIRRKAAFVEWLVEAAGIPGLAEALQRVRELPPARFGDGVDVRRRRHEDPAACRGGARGRLQDARASGFRRSDAARADGARRGRRAERPAAGHRLPAFAPARRRIPGHVERAIRADRPPDRRLGAGRRPHAVRRRRSDAVDLPLPRGRCRAVPRGAGAAHVAGVPVGVVELTRNFRSQREIVAWVNDVFRRCCRRVSDRVPRRGRVLSGASRSCERRRRCADARSRRDRAKRKPTAIVRRIARCARGGDHRHRRAGARAQPRAGAAAGAARAGIDYSAVELEGVARPAGDA